MKPEPARQLWRLRFLKILQVERESFDFYRKVLKERLPLLEETGAKPVIKQILRDEGRHIRIAQELVRLVEGPPVQ